MTKRICPSCGLGAYSSDTVTTWKCSNCGAEIAPRCEVEIERCKPDRLNEIRERAEKAKINVKDNPWWISTNVYISDVSYLLDELTRLRAELDAANKRADAAVRDMKFIADKINGCKSYLSGGTEKVGDLHLGRCSVCKRACEDGSGCRFEWRGTEARNENSRSV